MPIRGVTLSVPVAPAAITPTLPRPAPAPTTSSTAVPTAGISWSTTWTELPRTHLASSSSTLSVADRAVLGVVLGATTFSAGVALAAPTTVTYVVDHGDATATAHSHLFAASGTTDYTSALAANLEVAAAPIGAPTLGLTKAVGAGKANKHADVLLLQTRLAERGYPIDPDGAYGNTTDRAIRVFEAMITGAEQIADTTGVVTPGGALDRALASPHGPRWVEMPLSGPGFRRIDHDGFKHGSSIAADTIVAAGARYNADYLAAHPGKAPIAVNDVSRHRGGPNHDHQSHQAGLDIDVSLPTIAGGHSTRVGWASYDREATYAIIRAFAEDPRVERVLFSDQVLLSRISKSDFAWRHKVQDGGASHRDHLHIDVKPWTPPAAAAPA